MIDNFNVKKINIWEFCYFKWWPVDWWLFNLKQSSVLPSVSNLQNKLLIKNQQWDFDETVSEASWQCPLLNLVLCRTLVAMATKLKNFKKSSSPNWLYGFQYSLAWMFLGWTYSRFLWRNFYLAKTWPLWAGLISLYEVW